MSCDGREIPQAEQKRRARRRRRRRSLVIIGGRAHPRCECCGEKETDLLTIDHINNDGAQHRRELNERHMSLAQWIRDNPIEARRRLQVLCHSCHFGKDVLGGCPHHLRRARMAA